GLGHYEPSGYLQLHANLIERLPAVLRVYIGCACILYGDLDDVDLVKIHIRSGKVTLLSYENFDENPLPCLKERTKINLRQQDLDVFSYNGEHPTQVLYFKSRFLSEDYPNYEQQFEFDESLTSLGIVEPNSYGPPRETLEVLLSARRTKINGMELISSDEIPDLEDPCGRFLRYRDFVECSDTWNAQKPNNIPKQAQSYNAIYALASQVLDPVIDYFGMIKLTYGFSCPSLTKLIPHRIAPKLDQHAAYELNLRGSPICPRLGAAVDFIVEDEDMIEVANWIRENVTFDRMYVYGANRPIHISLSHAPSAQVTVMRSASNGKRLIPKNVVNRPIEEHDF
ncbi:MAG: DNA phosphorothioation-associated putative methyltransferase, partial [Oceanococcus sp.]